MAARACLGFRGAAAGLALLSAALVVSTAAAQPALLAPPPPGGAPAAAASPPAAGPATGPAAGAVGREPPAAAPRDLTPAYTAEARPGLKITKGSGILPNEHGQIWREYDISPYTLRAAGGASPQQTIIDWILRETGTEVWFSEPLGVLSATSTTLRVYHTPQVHEQVRSVVERFVGGDLEGCAVRVRLMTVGSPNWRARAIALLNPIDVKSAGVQAWLLSRESAAVLYEQLKSRGDFREHSAPQADIPSGQSQAFSRTQPRSYTRDVQLRREFPFYHLIFGQLDEGYRLEVSPLFSLDGQTVEAAIDCRIDQVEKLVPLAVDVPIGSQSQRVQIQVPQVASWRLSERFRWPANQVLLLSCGVVANPAGGGAGALSVLAPLGVATGNRADALLLIEPQEPIREGGQR